MTQRSGIQIPWPRLLAEATAIVASILLAFALDAAWSRHKDAQEEARTLERLQAEFEQNLPRLQTDVAALESLHGHAEGLLSLLESNPLERPVTVPDSLFAAFFFSSDWSSLETATLDALETSGRLDIINDNEVHEGLARWTAYKATMLQRQEESRAHFRNRAMPELSERMEVAPFVGYRSFYEESVDHAGFPWERPGETTVVRNSTMLRNLAAERILFIRAERIQAELGTAAIQELLETISSSLDR